MFPPFPPLPHLSRARPLLILSILLHSSTPVLSRSCYYDPVTGRTVCDGLPYGARLAIAAALTLVGILALTGMSYVVRRRFANANGPPPVSAGYYGPPQTYPPNVAYAQPNTYAPPVPAYAPPPGPPPPGYNPYMQQPMPKHDAPQPPPNVAERPS